jgi:hypothetical protein
LRALKNVPAVEMDSWHQYARWNDVLSRSKHDMVKTFHYTRDPDAGDRDDESNRHFLISKKSSVIRTGRHGTNLLCKLSYAMRLLPR